MQLGAVTARPVVAADQAFLLRLYGSTRTAELALTRWTEAQCLAFVRMQFDAQSRHYQQAWPAAQHSVLEWLDGAMLQPVGRLWLDGRPETLRILDIALLPDCCGRGLGSQVLLQLMADAAASARTVTIAVEQSNPARRLYDRLGFQPQGQVRGIHQTMVWQSSTAKHPRQELCDEQT